ncbi:MAG: RdgB/HAM1 family non-canonical purine NTP pyrophosphatase [Oscillospiraceae bacterium]|nr:RdgB/HAM1 family non-canonical purine NTP pyrophosphatase [Candidatus Equicaccousia limihippi]
MEKIILATHNKHKIAEFERMLNTLGIKVETPDLPEVDEDGATCKENALKKAKSAFEYTGLPCVADDTGLMVDALGGEPGVYSARYAGENCTPKDNRDKMLAALNGVPYKERTARFVTCIAFVSKDITFTVEGFCEGYITETDNGLSDFGYDNIFECEKGVFSAISGQQKDSVSHRGRALAAFVQKIKELNL